MNIGALCVEGTVNAEPYYWTGKARDYGFAAIKVVSEAGDFAGLDALIIPGGSSEIILDSIHSLGLDVPIKAMAAAGKHIWGRCAGLVCIAETVIEPDSIICGDAAYGPLNNAPLALLPVSVARLGYPTAYWRPTIHVRDIAKGIAYFADGPRIVGAPWNIGETYFEGGFVWPDGVARPEFVPASVIRKGNIMGTSFWDGDEKLMRPLMKWWLNDGKEEQE